MSKRWLLVAAALTMAACGDASTSVSPLVIDSAGTPVVRHVLQPSERLTIRPEPELTLGIQPDGSDALYRVRGGILLPGGGIVIANSGSSELFYFSSTGELVHRVGGEGRGPSEFSNILWIERESAGALAVADAGNLRIARLDDQGAFLSTRSVSVESEGEADDGVMRGPGFPIGVAAGDRVVMVPWASAALDGVAGPLPLRGELRRYSGDLSEYQPLDSVRLRTWYETEQPEGPPIGQILESPIFLFAGSGPWIAYSEAITHRITVLRDGAVSYVIEEARPRQPFRPDSVPDHLAAAADSLPTYRELQVDADGRVWAKSPPGEGSSRARWTVFSDRGRTARTLELSPSSSVLDAVGDRLLLLERDSLDVETVSIHRIAGEGAG